MDEPNVPRVLRLLEPAGLECPLEVDEASYFLSTIELRRGDAPGMTRWRKRLFLATAAHHRRRRRVLRPAARAHRDHGLADRGLTAASLGLRCYIQLISCSTGQLNRSSAR